jgi:basic membrane lipoprotein Med (substrate-binding protein (PBP1-ABC) superfamily)
MRQQFSAYAPVDESDMTVGFQLMKHVHVANVFLLIATIITGAGCTNEPSKPGKLASATFQVALLTPGPVSDAGWNAAAYDGLQLIGRRLGAQTALVQTASPADFDDAFRDFAARGFKLIFAHGFEYTDAALSAGRQFPQSYFVVTSGSGFSANVASVTFKIEQGAYVLGVLAGAMSTTGVAGTIGGIELPAIKVTFKGFERGFMSVRPKGRVLTSFIGSFDDVGAAKEAALAEISQGADMLFHNADAAGLGVFQAAVQRHVYAFGSNRDQNDVAPAVVLASAVTSIPQAFLKIASEVKAGDFHPHMIEFGMADGMVRVVVNERLASRIPPIVMTQVKETEQAIMNGKIALPSE